MSVSEDCKIKILREEYTFPTLSTKETKDDRVFKIIRILGGKGYHQLLDISL